MLYRGKSYHRISIMKFVVLTTALFAWNWVLALVHPVLQEFKYAVKIQDKKDQQKSYTLIIMEFYFTRMDKGTDTTIPQPQLTSLLEELSYVPENKRNFEHKIFCEFINILNKNNIIQVGGCLHSTFLSYISRYQIIIPYSYCITKLSSAGTHL